MNDPEPEMSSTEFRFTSTDGVRVACARWDARAPVRCALPSFSQEPSRRSLQPHPGCAIRLVSARYARTYRSTCSREARIPLGQQLQGVKVLIGRYQKAGISCISHDFYLGGRHEMLNEINRDEVRTRLLGWISSVLEQKPIDPAAR